ncbi:MAG TPA: flagellar hook-length control protein FliK [Burkholderiales bacterium]|nr:flagellar hook-length control protein FliK [Burkholderiales bacterium]
MSMPLAPTVQITASPAAQDKSSAAAPTDTSFNHVLSNEMSQQQQNAKTANAQPAPAATTAAVAAAPKKSSDSPATADAANVAAPLQSALPPISAELLAMMGNYPAAPVAPPPVTGSTATLNSKTALNNSTPAAARYQQEILTTPPLLPTSIAPGATPAVNTTADQTAMQPSLPAAVKFAETLKTAVLSGNDVTPPALQQTKDTIMPVPAASMMPLLPNPATLATAAQASTLPSTAALAPSVGTAAWNQALGEKVVWMSGASGDQTASLSLNPPDLGPLQIVLNVNNNQANATFIAAQPEVRLAIEAALPRLHEMMNNAGIQLGQTNVRSDTSSQQERQSEAQAFRPLSGVRAAAADKSAGNSGKIMTGKGLVNTFV